MARPGHAVIIAAFLSGIVTTLLLILFFGRTQDTIFLHAHKPAYVGFGGYDANSSELRRPRYLVGVGKADITGPSVEIHFMGYADPGQRGSGIRQRIYSRAFIIGDPDKPEDRFVYIVQDVQSGDTAVRQGVLDGLKGMGEDYAVYGAQNIAISGTHSHSGPGGYNNYLLPQLTSLGFSKSSYNAIVQGTLRSIQLAHESIRPAHITSGAIRVPHASANRSPFSYLANPVAERERYKDTVDKQLTMLKFQSADDHTDLGVLTWFAVHGTTMLANQTLVTGDNKGTAADMFEKYAKRLEYSSPDFVAGFSQSNVGDASPNILGAYCEFGPQAGQQCDFKTSLCAGKAEPCHARAPHWGLRDGGASGNFESGRRQYVAARKLFESMKDEASTSGPDVPGVKVVVKAVHKYADFANRGFKLPTGQEVRTCPAALGYSFAAGTTDWPGNLDFKQHNIGEPDANPLWAIVGNSINKPDAEQKACHGAKPILLNVGHAFRPYAWSPNIVDVQFFRVANFFIVVSAGETTTMAGRRWRDVVKSTALSTIRDLAPDARYSTARREDVTVVIGGPSNTYAHYITTEEEYAIQRYEGASTLHGPYTLAGYLDLTKSLVPYLSSASTTSKNATLPPTNPHLPGLVPGPSPPIHTAVSLSVIQPVLRDSPGMSKVYGAVTTDVLPKYTIPHPSSRDRKTTVVEAEFVAANPRNNLRLEGSFALVERKNLHTGVWATFRDDSDWALVFEWKRLSTMAGTSRVSIRWELGWEVGVWGRMDDVSEETAKTELRHRRRRRWTLWKRWWEAEELDPMDIVGSKVRGYPRDDYRSARELRGIYRIRYFGDAKSLGGNIQPFEGVSGEFRLV